jgi:hypothetical protein
MFARLHRKRCTTSGGQGCGRYRADQSTLAGSGLDGNGYCGLESLRIHRAAFHGICDVIPSLHTATARHARSELIATMRGRYAPAALGQQAISGVVRLRSDDRLHVGFGDPEFVEDLLHARDLAHLLHTRRVIIVHVLAKHTQTPRLGAGRLHLLRQVVAL